MDTEGGIVQLLVGEDEVEYYKQLNIRDPRWNLESGWVNGSPRLCPPALTLVVDQGSRWTAAYFIGRSKVWIRMLGIAAQALF